ncbi:adhesin, partial [Proteus sp. G2661]|nr:adhesin [Proteus sp. G2661]
MSINVILRSGIALVTVLSSIPAYAACTAINPTPVVVNMQMGRVIVSPDLPVGSVIKEEPFPMPSNVGTYAICDGKTPMQAIVTGRGMTPGANKVYSTNIPGIGLRFERIGSISMIYPDVYKINGNPARKFKVSLADSTFKLQVIKIAENTGSG